MDNKKLLGRRIRELRKRKNINQEKLAELSGFESSNSISNIENGYNYPSIQNLEKILNVLDSSFVEIFDFEHKKDNEDLIKEINLKLKENPEKIKDIYNVIVALTK